LLLQTAEHLSAFIDLYFYLLPPELLLPPDEEDEEDDEDDEDDELPEL
jgi:hypothetical protein